MIVLFPKIVRFLFSLWCVASAAEEQWTISSGGTDVPFKAWQECGYEVGAGVLVLVPGYNGNGELMMDGRWRDFAEKNDLLLLAATFKAEGSENNHGKGYYYPEQGSGKILEEGIAEAGRRYGVQTEKVLFFGFSAGAHVSHRFALWKPERVAAYVAYSAAWWSEPTVRMREVPALIMCGEEDPRYEASLGFFRKGRILGAPWIWRSYKDTGHVLTPAVRTMAEAFLAYHAAKLKGLAANDWKEPVPLYGDIQGYGVSAEKDKVAEEFRVTLPSEEIADVWRREK